MKKRNMFFAFLLVVMMVTLLTACRSNLSIQNSSDEPSLVADNGQFVIYEESYYNDAADGKTIHITVRNKSTGDIQFEDSPCRASDYYGVSFVKNSNDIEVDSHDIGNVRYKYLQEDNKWYKEMQP